MGIMNAESTMHTAKFKSIIKWYCLTDPHNSYTRNLLKAGYDNTTKNLIYGQVMNL